jgi:hypothetical protein
MKLSVGVPSSISPVMFAGLLLDGDVEEGKFLVRLPIGKDKTFQVQRQHDGQVSVRRMSRSSREDLDLSFRRTSISRRGSLEPRDQASLYGDASFFNALSSSKGAMCSMSLLLLTYTHRLHRKHIHSTQLS